MRYKSKTAKIIIASGVIVLLLSVPAVYAHGGFNRAETVRTASRPPLRRLARTVGKIRLELLGLTRDEFRDKIKAGISFEDILKEAGYDDVGRFRQALKDRLREDIKDKNINLDRLLRRLVVSRAKRH